MVSRATRETHTATMALRRDYVLPPIPLRAAVQRLIQKHASLLAVAKELGVHRQTITTIVAGAPVQRTSVAKVEMALGLPPSQQVTLYRLEPSTIGEHDAGDRR